MKIFNAISEWAVRFAIVIGFWILLALALHFFLMRVWGLK